MELLLLLYPCALAGWVGGFLLLSASPAAKFTQAWCGVFLVVSAVIQEVQQSSSAHSAPLPSAGQERVPDRALSPLHPLLHPPATAPARPLIPTASAESLCLLFPQLSLSLGSHPSSPSPCPPSLRSPAAPQPWEAQQLLNQQRAKIPSQQRASRCSPTLLRLPSSICQLLSYILAGSAM